MHTVQTNGVAGGGEGGLGREGATRHVDQLCQPEGRCGQNMTTFGKNLFGRVSHSRWSGVTPPLGWLVKVFTAPFFWALQPWRYALLPGFPLSV